jgi:SAM-dependent methyltransferase
LLELLHRNRIRAGPIVDLGCGSGIWARHLTNAGYQVIGVDISAAMIDLAHKRAPDAVFQVGSVHKFDFPPCRAITALGEVLCYRDGGSNNHKSLASLFQKAAAALAPAGVLIFDVAEVGLDKNRPPTYRAGADWACLVRFEYDARRDQLIRHITSFRQVGMLYRRQEESHHVQLFRRGEITEMLRKVGLRVRTVRSYGDYNLLPGRIGFIAHEPSPRKIFSAISNRYLSIANSLLLRFRSFPANLLGPTSCRMRKAAERGGFALTES